MRQKTLQVNSLHTALHTFKNRQRKTARLIKKVLPLLISYGAPGVTRTRDPRLRRPLLYPTELRALKIFYNAQIIQARKIIVNIRLGVKKIPFIAQHPS